MSTDIALPPEKRAAVERAVLTWYRRSHRDLPWRHTRDPYAILVSEVMLQQTQVDRVIPKFLEWMGRYPTLAALAAAPRGDVIRAWSGLGYNLRAVRLHEIARQVVERFGREGERGKRGSVSLPDTLEGLLSLKGIGRYTAAAVMCFARGAPEPVLDTNVRRVLGRIYAAEAPAAIEDDRVAWPLAEAALPPDSDVYDWNQALMDIGAAICLSRNPRCLLCPAQERCTARHEWFAPDQAMVAERRAAYAARRPKQGKFEGSRRWYRGQIVAALRDAPDGIAVERLAERVALDAPSAGEIVAALARDGLVEVSDGLARLPS